LNKQFNIMSSSSGSLYFTVLKVQYSPLQAFEQLWPSEKNARKLPDSVLLQTNYIE